MFKRFFFLILLFFLNLSNPSFSEIVKKIVVEGNERISSETINIFSQISINDNLDPSEINNILKKIYISGFFEDVLVNFSNGILTIKVKENPIIQSITYEGVKANKIKDVITENLDLRERSSFNENLLLTDQNKILDNLRSLGYYFANVEVYKEDLQDNKVDIIYKINLGNKAKIGKISFLGNKVFKDNKLKRLIISEEHKFWKIISGKKYLNTDVISLDTRLLKNYYLNKGYYNVKINTSFAKLIGDDAFELIFNIDSGKKVFFNNLSLSLPDDFDKNNFFELDSFFQKIKNEPYSINSIQRIIKKLEEITLIEEYRSINASIKDEVVDDKINIVFKIDKSADTFVERINIYGNSITRENVIRNRFFLDEGDPYNEILKNKTINEIRSLNFFKTVEVDIEDNPSLNSKIINILVEEKPTGEIYATAGAGTSGGSFAFGIKENNFLGNGIGLDTKFSISADSFKGKFSVTNPNFNNSDKSLFFSAEATENDNYKTFGYKSNKTGISIGTDFEYLNDFYIGLNSSNFYEVIDTNSSASSQQQAQEGNYWDSFIKLNMNYDKRNQKFQTSDGFKSFYSVDLPIISDTNTFKNYYNYSHYFEFFEKNFSSISIYLQSANSLNNKDIKLSERITVPGSRLRGFEAGRIGPKDGDDYIGGNYSYSINFVTNIPQFFEESQNLDFLFFADAANLWGVDYDSSIEGDGLRSSIGLALDWTSPIGPLNFSLAYPVTKENGDRTESLRFNLGTTF